VAVGLALPSTAFARRAGAALADAESPAELIRSFATRPDLRPPAVTVTVPPPSGTFGQVFVAPFSVQSPPPEDAQFGPLIVDDTGEPIWFRPLEDKVAMNFRVQRYKGRRVLTWWEGQFPEGYGGEFVILDSSYRELARVRAKRDLQADLHEFVITSRGSALLGVYSEVGRDLTSIGGPADGRVVDAVIQEIDIASGRLLFEWSALDHVALEETYIPTVTEAGNVDYFHWNSVGVDRDTHLLVSARHTSAVYKIHRRTGEVLWRLGGKRSDFRFEPGATFAYQHDVRTHADETITLFDNAAATPRAEDVVSRPIRLALDMATMTARLVRSYASSESPRLAFAMGNAQQLPDQGMFVGWGTYPSFNEVGPTGETRFDARFTGTDLTYRAFRYGWIGRPRTRPATVVGAGPDGTRSLLVSWNGATEVARWRLRVGPAAATARAVATVDRTGFETAIPLAATGGIVVVDALDRDGRILRSSLPLDVTIDSG
jgi:Arylsulfotransferase (ASST)